ncbi:copper homeostasis protein CutC [Streptomyces sulfonofaciens]|uniref:Copper homeostasis protein cutC homolog n=1 Tax=Streptomyces sulfonofaciens TaxID=68272 RepID=A0A919FMY1_9ACTN|nr:copper homeostasis protein CutC [Streptomyces sulfonofaciens]GHH69156.1 copper homeostasis protein CutC [Streptomyces sulfonofaciens]
MSNPAGRALLEVIGLDARDAAAAQQGGADRIELVSDMAADGLTPSCATFAAVRAAVDIPVRVMLRPSGGFTPASSAEVAALVRSARALRAEGAAEFVLGFLDGRGAPDTGVVEEVVGELDGSRWTFHRAIDHAADRAALRGQLADLTGLDTYLTAGSPLGVDEGLPVLLAEAARRGEPGYAQELLVGGGLRPGHVERLRAGGVRAFHIGRAARPGGWQAPVSAAAVREWRTALDR